jgi:hypothetical protein
MLLQTLLSQEKIEPCTTLYTIPLFTQVRSPAVRLRLASCTACVKRWSKAMDFLQTIFKTNIFLSRIFENYM